MVAAYEDERSFEPAGGYGGIVPGHVDLGPLDRYLLGGARAFTADGSIDVLGCLCGEWRCWPLVVRVDVDGDTVTWSDFQQTHRPDRDFRGLGPFTFDLAQYRSAAARAKAVFAPEQSAGGEG